MAAPTGVRVSFPLALAVVTIQFRDFRDLCEWWLQELCESHALVKELRSRSCRRRR
jgi:hypothetical protein